MPDALNTAWMLLCAALVLVMQAGFLCLETGLVRAKNSINVAIKNLTDLCVSGLVFWCFGYALMFGATREGWLDGWLGGEGFFFDGAGSPWLTGFFVYQLMFCSTAATIVSGAVAERMRFLGYLLTAVLLSALIYPVTGHWGWGGIPRGEAEGWLGRLGFIDFAGSTLVHSVGGWVALAAVLRLGPRLGRFSGDGGLPIQGSNLPLATLGVILLWFGWFGFNGGSTLELNDQVPLILLNTFLAAASGGLAAVAFSYAYRRYPSVPDLLNGVIGGLVAITASCHLQQPGGAVLIGGVAGLMVALGSLWLVRLRIDDAVGAIPAHLFAGIWGTLAVALFAPASVFELAGGRLAQLWIQTLGVLSVGLYAFGVSLVLLWLIDRWYRLRIDPQSERTGLNVAEHAASTEILDLLDEMERQRRHGDFSRPATAEPHTEIGQIARQYNHVLERVNEEIHRREELVRALSASESRKGAILDAALDCIITIDHQGEILEFNPAAGRTFGCSQRRAVGASLMMLAIPAELRANFEQALGQGFAGEGRFVLNQRIQTVLQRADGATFPSELSITRVLGGQRPEYNLHVRDISRQREIQRRLHQLAHFDTLTGLANRNQFRQGLTYYLMSGTPRQAAVLFLDLDRFKTINDSLGHAAGDQLLRSVANRLRQCTRGDDLVGRWGGDEFVIALFGIESAADVAAKAQHYLRLLADPHDLDGKSVRAHASIGAALYPEGGESADLLIRNADLALYQAKSAGRNTYQFFTPELAQQISERFDCENDLREALDRGEYELFFQPQLTIATGELIGAEVLLRWRHPVKGVVSPAVFIPILEEVGLIDTVGEWVIRAACQQHRRWQRQGLILPRLAVNVSGRQFLRAGFADTLAQILEEEGLGARHLELEITETVLTRDTAQCIQTLARLKSLGIEIAVDDFGTGYSSLSYLKRFPIDTIKLDRAFVSECDVNEEDAAICAAIISLARSLGLKTVAEGVEAEGQLAFLDREGCLAYQGFLNSPPVPAPEMEQILRRAGPGQALSA